MAIVKKFMNASKIKTSASILFFIILAGTGYVFRDQLSQNFGRLWNRYLPCTQPITYKIGNFDERFNISQDDFLAAVARAEQIWQTPVNKKLFTYSPDSAVLTINLVYDFRQESTLQLQKLGIAIHDDRSSYDVLKAEYDSLQAAYNQQKTVLDILNNNYQAQEAAYEEAVAFWNSRGGAPVGEFNKLNREKQKLNDQAIIIEQAQGSLNELVNSINAVVDALNKLARELNLGVSDYNNIGAQRGSEFQEGQYKSDATGQEINIYQFDNKNKLIRVLAHELGHALGLDHSDNPKSIMYRINEGSNEMPTPDDIVAIKKICRVE
ncbi:MAG: matrixin [Parcubacteria group bacterium GW2011_GWC2_42_6]|nr:MAG: matrixin [Parcubacteria group bacterium GW2011_GWA2_42_11]KKS66547.1 MAG: matrixin [Parcubacteria group bacterium GW2011_GWC2_42_6]KKT76583.1 MAG: matrixin [Parcubacteria group bacterium GW2011_GWF2_44_7]